MKRSQGKVVLMVCLTLCIATMLGACGNVNPLIGTWKDNNEDGLTIAFTQEGKFEISSEDGPMLTGSYTVDGETLALQCDQTALSAGPWSVKNNTLTLTLDNSVHHYQRQSE